MFFLKIRNSLLNAKIVPGLVRFIQTEASTKVLVPLKNRNLMKICGQDTQEFLQGLITNDMKHFENGANSIFAMFLNNKGRVLYDTLIYKWDGDNSFIIDCDKNIIEKLEKHLKMYKLRRAVNIENVSKVFNVWALISPINLEPDVKLDPKNPINIFKDPRLSEMGCRILTHSALAAPEIIEMINENGVVLGDEEIYRYLRYKLGVGEGSEELPPGNCLPLEANCDYLHGVSFHKGCYIGQELTARVHHTGVVRKRHMPVKFQCETAGDLKIDTAITTLDTNKNLGKLKGSIHDTGLGLVRIKEATDAKVLKIGDLNAEVYRPDWWPIEAPKEKEKI